MTGHGLGGLAAAISRLFNPRGHMIEELFLDA